MRKLVLERDCPGQQIFPSEEGAIFRGALKSQYEYNLVSPIRDVLQQDLSASPLRSYLLPHLHGSFSPVSQLALLRCKGNAQHRV